jgi:hypothetical protein
MTILIRTATLKDKAWLLACALEQAEGLYLNLRPSKEKIEALIVDCISAPSHYARVVEENGTLRGCLMAMVRPNLWAERQAASVLLWVSQIPAQGAKLLREFRRWVEGRRGIKVAGLSPDFNWPDERVGDLIERIGFTKCGASYMYYN